MAKALRGSIDAPEYKHVALGLIFLNNSSDAFEERYVAMLAECGKEAAKDQYEYVAENIFRVSPEARSRQLIIGQTVDRAIAAIDRNIPELKLVTELRSHHSTARCSMPSTQWT